MSGIFISYRRGQTSAYAGRLYDRLAAAFGEDRVFMDLNAIDPGADFVERIEEAVGGAEALLVIIGPDWADASDADGRPRLAEPDDFVRRELLGAWERDTLIVPVLVQGARMPPEDRLPEPLRFLSRRHAVELTDAAWSRDIGGLVETLQGHLPARAPRRRAVTRKRAAVAALISAVAVPAVVALATNREPGGAGPQRSELRVAGEAVVGGYPLYASIAGGKLWVVQSDEDRLKVVAASDRAVSDSGLLGTKLNALVAADGRLWVGAFGEKDGDGRGTVVDVEPATGLPAGPPIRTTDPLDIAADGTSLWVADIDGLLQRVDIASRRVTREIPIQGDAAALDVAILDGVAWAPVNETGELLAFDARTGRRRGRPVKVGARPLSIAAAGGMLWVATEQGQLIRVSPNGGAPRSLAIGGEGYRVVEADAHGVWIVDAQGYVVLVDPARFVVRAKLRLQGGALQDIALDAGGAWVLRSRSGAPSTVVRVVLDTAD